MSTTAPRLSTLETKMYSLPRERRSSSVPLLVRASKMSPWPGGYQLSREASYERGTGKRDSRVMRGKRD